jgi:hypothetical protein
MRICLMLAAATIVFLGLALAVRSQTVADSVQLVQDMWRHGQP